MCLVRFQLGQTVNTSGNIKQFCDWRGWKNYYRAVVLFDSQRKEATACMSQAHRKPRQSLRTQALAISGRKRISSNWHGFGKEKTTWNFILLSHWAQEKIQLQHFWASLLGLRNALIMALRLVLKQRKKDIWKGSPVRNNVSLIVLYFRCLLYLNFLWAYYNKSFNAAI